MSFEPVQRSAMLLLRAIYEKTQGRSRAVRDVTELETGLTPEDSRSAWRDLLDRGLIERFSQDYAARLSVQGLDYIQSDPPLPAPPPEPLPPQVPLRKVFIVHGSDTGAREAVAQFVTEMGLEAVLLGEQADNGRTIMEQVEAHGEVGFAVILMTLEELGYSGGTTELRPSMNVLMELGYFMGRFGRTKVRALVINSPMGIATDLAGVALDSLDASGEWRGTLRRELQAAGLI
jgi:hypothetical protein